MLKAAEMKISVCIALKGDEMLTEKLFRWTCSHRRWLERGNGTIETLP
jgi:hypothetical protein